APKKNREPGQARPESDRFSSTPSAVDDEYAAESEPQHPWRRSSKRSPLVEPAPLPPAEPSGSWMTYLATFAAVSVVSALAVVAFYRFAGNTASPVAVPQLASSATRPVQIVTVRPPPTMPDEGS